MSSADSLRRVQSLLGEERNQGLEVQQPRRRPVLPDPGKASVRAALLGDHSSGFALSEYQRAKRKRSENIRSPIGSPYAFSHPSAKRLRLSCASVSMNLRNAFATPKREPPAMNPEAISVPR